MAISIALFVIVDKLIANKINALCVKYCYMSLMIIILTEKSNLTQKSKLFPPPKLPRYNSGLDAQFLLLKGYLKSRRGLFSEGVIYSVHGVLRVWSFNGRRDFCCASKYRTWFSMRLISVLSVDNLIYTWNWMCSWLKIVNLG